MRTIVTSAWAIGLVSLVSIACGSSGDSAASDLTCYSPTQNLDKAYDPGAKGCPCDDGGVVCSQSGVDIMCSGGVWESFFDGPCGLRAPLPTKDAGTTPPLNSDS